MSSPIRLAAKDPDEVGRYGIDWNSGPLGAPGILQSLGSDAITGTPAWSTSSPAGLTLSGQANTTTTTTITASGGIDGVDYTVTCTIVTAAGETLEQSIIIPVRNKDS